MPSKKCSKHFMNLFCYVPSDPNFSLRRYLQIFVIEKKTCKKLFDLKILWGKKIFYFVWRDRKMVVTQWNGNICGNNPIFFKHDITKYYPNIISFLQIHVLVNDNECKQQIFSLGALLSLRLNATNVCS